jgi:hypothetical protein
MRPSGWYDEEGIAVGAQDITAEAHQKRPIVAAKLSDDRSHVAGVEDAVDVDIRPAPVVRVGRPSTVPLAVTVNVSMTAVRCR